MEEINIDKDVPLSRPYRQAKADPKQSPLWPMEINDSFVVPITERGAWQMRLHRFKQRTGRVFSLRTINDKQIRVWRVK